MKKKDYHTEKYVYRKGKETNLNDDRSWNRRHISTKGCSKRVSARKKDRKKTKEQLINELVKLRKRITELEKSETEIKKSMAKTGTSKERKQTGDRLEKESKAIAAVVNDMLRGEVDDAQTEERVLDACLVATDSVYGMIGVINEHGKYDTTTYSNQTLQDCAFPEALTWEISKGMTIRGIWGWPMLHGKPLLCNDMQAHPGRVGFPKGHVSLGCFLGVPLIHGGKVVGMVAVANKPGGYKQEDLNTLIRLASVMSVSHQHRLALRAAKRTSAELEKLVAERTKQLSESDAKSRTLVENLPQRIFFKDRNSVYVTCNENYAQEMGITPEEIVGKTDYDFHPKDLAEKCKRNDKRIIKSGKTEDIEEEYIKNGRKLWVQTVKTPVKDEEGEIMGVLGIFWDITERKKAEEALKESEGRYRDLVEKAGIAILIDDEEGNIKYANKKAAELYGCSLKEMKKQSIKSLVHPDDFKMVIKFHKSRVQGKRAPSSYVFRGIKKDGSIRYLELDATQNKKGESIIGTRTYIRDVTARRKAEEQIKASLREKDVLLQEVHHRVKNNMQLISSLFNLQSGRIKDKQAFEIFKSSQNRVRSIALIHERLYESKDLTRVDFAEYSQSLTTHLFSSYGINTNVIKFYINIKDVFLDINTAIPCSLIINELVSNSLKHAFPADKNGEIKIAMHPLNKDEMELIVSDNGVGLPKKVDFRDTDSLGLHLVTILVEDQLHGAIKLDRERGTIFHIRFRRNR